MVVENKKDIFLAISINTGLCYCDEYLICNGGTNHICNIFWVQCVVKILELYFTKNIVVVYRI